MSDYKSVLIALELNKESDQRLVDKAKAFIEAGVDVSLVHSVEHMTSYGAAYGVAAGIDVEEALREEADAQIKVVGSALSIAPERQFVKVGPAKFVILEEAKAHHCDLIVVGSHGRHGVRLLLGSTANAVLHGAECDVLAVRLSD